jgi:hypothetical protein
LITEQLHGISAQRKREAVVPLARIGKQKPTLRLLPRTLSARSLRSQSTPKLEGTNEQLIATGAARFTPR